MKTAARPPQLIRDCRIEFNSVRAWREDRRRERYGFNGERECLRRQRQIAAGQLKPENGLLVL